MNEETYTYGGVRYIKGEKVRVVSVEYNADFMGRVHSQKSSLQ